MDFEGLRDHVIRDPRLSTSHTPRPDEVPGRHLVVDEQGHEIVPLGHQVTADLAVLEWVQVAPCVAGSLVVDALDLLDQSEQREEHVPVVATFSELVEPVPRDRCDEVSEFEGCVAQSLQNRHADLAELVIDRELHCLDQCDHGGVLVAGTVVLADFRQQRPELGHLGVQVFDLLAAILDESGPIGQRLVLVRARPPCDAGLVELEVSVVQPECAVVARVTTFYGGLGGLEQSGELGLLVGAARLLSLALRQAHGKTCASQKQK